MKKYIYIIFLIIIVFLVIYFIIMRVEVRKKPTHEVYVYCLGDSITAGSYPQYIESLLKKINKNVHVINKGVPGHNSYQYLKYMIRNKFPNDEMQIDYVLIQLGTNDIRIDTDQTSTEQFIKNMKEIIHRFKMHRNDNDSHPKVFLSTIPPIVIKIPHFFDETSRSRVEKEINPAIFQIGQEENCPVVNNYELFINNPNLLPEIHPNEDGYKAMAENWFKMLSPYIKKSLQ